MTHVPMRRCVACGQRMEKRALVRFRAGADGTLVLDVEGRAEGRGAYVCRSRPCLDRALDRRLFTRGLKRAVQIIDRPAIERSFEGLLLEAR